LKNTDLNIRKAYKGKFLILTSYNAEWCPLGCYAMWFLQEPHGVTSQKTPFFIVTAMKTSNLTSYNAFNILLNIGRI
jgi:hypothetical protein